jgi:UDP-N-acetylmuramyl pentapeptide phosphotransferase/UDP-N-acetylglucosamine-1-phosphate transferase
MLMMTQIILPLIGGLFIVLGVVLFTMARRDAKQDLPIASRSRMKVAVIFSIVGAGLTGFYLFFK